MREHRTRVRVSEAFRAAASSEGAWISTVVLVEVSWVLRVAYRFERAAIATALKRLLASEGVVIEDAPLISRALEAYETGTADFADYVILGSSRNANALPVLTFDETSPRRCISAQVRGKPPLFVRKISQSGRAQVIRPWQQSPVAEARRRPRRTVRAAPRSRRRIRGRATASGVRSLAARKTPCA